MPNFTGKNGIPTRLNSSFVDIVTVRKQEPPPTPRGWQTPDYNIHTRGTGTRTDSKVPTS